MTPAGPVIIDQQAVGKHRFGGQRFMNTDGLGAFAVVIDFGHTTYGGMVDMKQRVMRVFIERHGGAVRLFVLKRLIAVGADDNDIIQRKFQRFARTGNIVTVRFEAFGGIDYRLETISRLAAAVRVTCPVIARGPFRGKIVILESVNRG